MPGPAKVEAVVFDLGGVLIDWDPRHLYRPLFEGDEAAMEHFLSHVCTPAWNLEHDRGITLAENAARLKALHPENADLIDAFGQRWPEMMRGEVPGSVAILEKLVAQGVPVFALTNFSHETFPFALERFPFLQRFRGILVSGHERLVKPDEAIFRLAAERFALDPARTLFIDDALPNVEGAIRAGFQAHHFSGADELRSRLTELDLLG